MPRYQAIRTSSRGPSITAGAHLLCAETVIPSASVITLNATAVDVVEDPGDGRIIIFQEAYIRLNHGGTNYDDAAGDGDLLIRYDAGGATVSTTLEADTFIDATADAHRTLKQLTTDITPVPSSGLELFNNAGEFSGGNGSLIVTVFYYNLPTKL